MPRKENKQMKKKIFLLASVAMGVALVGTTFAKWAVTDNADPFSIKVSTGEVSSDATTEYVTLSWGSSQKMGNVSNLAMNSLRRVGVLDLRADTESENTPDGTLSYVLSGDKALKDVLEVHVYQGDVEEANLGSATEVTGFVSGSKVLQVNAKQANLYTVAVKLASSINDAAKYAALKDKVVDIEFDWAKGTDVLEAHTIYVTGFSGTPKMYAWNDSEINANWPGVDMTPVAGADGYYTAELAIKYTKVIFSYNGDEQKSEDITIASSFSFTGTIKNLYNHDGATFSEMPEVKEPEYFLIGSFNSWTQSDANYKMTKVSANEYTKAVTVEANATLKVFEGTSKMYYSSVSPWDGCGFTIDGDGNIQVTAAGTYTVHFYPNGDNGNLVTLGLPVNP